MIERLQRIATILARFRLALFLLAGFSLGVLVLSMVENPWLEGDALLMPAVLGFCWALLLYSTGEIFQRTPGKAAEGTTFRRRMALRVRRLVFWVLGLLTVGSAIALLFLSYQLLRVWL
ncbi:MAG: hypothetical protein WDZ52_15035 [Pseudohongiellaceae bacterium]